MIEFSPYPILLLDGSNPIDDRLIAKNLQAILTGIYGNAKIPISELDRKLFENQKEQKEQKKPKLVWGPKPANANVLERDTLYFHTDQLGSTRVVTREDGSLYQYLNYMPFGKILEGAIIGPELPSWSAFKNSYTGQEYDRSTGLYFYQSRFYDAEIGRFISADTVIPQPADGQTFNRYTYVNNNPFKFTDPTGHNAIVSFLVGLVEAIVVGAAFVVGTIIGGPALGLLFGMLVAGAISAIHAAIAGATGQEIMSAFVLGALMAGVSSSNIVIGIIMAGVGIYQAVASNDPDAMAACVGGLVGGYLSRPFNELIKGGWGGGTSPSAQVPQSDFAKDGGTGSDNKGDSWKDGLWAMTKGGKQYKWGSDRFSEEIKQIAIKYKNNPAIRNKLIDDVVKAALEAIERGELPASAKKAIETSAKIATRGGKYAFVTIEFVNICSNILIAIWPSVGNTPTLADTCKGGYDPMHFKDLESYSRTCEPVPHLKKP